jgi:hypothetical protein
MEYKNIDLLLVVNLKKVLVTCFDPLILNYYRS